ncbi:hypothetical protein LC608_17660 [Nostoc sp. XA010]|uniref:hypothetical protein n=1 Tax=Nostoc sp. XA010 TaxID=2780407 RepID=UPI001E397E93|nr:hypothetical protein [Nostoc sp. XA010]MCC5658779.1 hypothetical protein [Nostoc sp. XA010]
MNLFNYSLGTAIIQSLGSLAIAGYVIAAIFSLILRCNIYQAKLMVAASLLKTINLQT